MMTSGGIQPGMMPSFEQIKMMIMFHCQRGNFALTLGFLAQNPHKVNELTDSEGQTPLHWASIARNEEVCRKLVNDFKMDVNARATHTLQTPVHWATIAGDLQILQVFQEAGGDLEAVDSVGATPLILSIQRQHLKIFLWLCSMGCDQSIRDKNGNSIAHWAAYTNNVDVIRLLIYFGNELDSSQVDNNGCTPIHLAALQGHFDVCTVLCRESKVDVRAKEKFGRSAIDCARERGDTKLAEQLEREANFQEVRRNRLANASRSVSDVMNEGNVTGAVEMILSRAKKVFKLMGVTRWDNNVAPSSSSNRYGYEMVNASVIGNSSSDSDLDSEIGKSSNKKMKFKLKHLRNSNSADVEASFKELEESISGVSSSAWRENFEPESLADFEKREEARNLPFIAKIFSIFFDLEGRNFGWASGGMRRFIPAILVYVVHFGGLVIWHLDITARNNAAMAKGRAVPFYASNTFIYAMTAFFIFHVLHYTRLSFSNPGMLAKRKRGDSAIEEALNMLADSADSALECDPKRICLSCREWKPLRSKHCRVCGCCVRTMDHHCVWINNCVGKHNHRSFMLFVVLQFLVALLSTPILVRAICQDFNSAREMQMNPFLTFVIFFFSSFHYIALELMCVGLMIWLGMLGNEQFGFICNNTLLNEIMNWSKYEHLHNYVRLRRKTKVDEQGNLLNNSVIPKHLRHPEKDECATSCCPPNKTQSLPLMTELPAPLTPEEKELGFAIREIVETHKVRFNPFSLGSRTKNFTNWLIHRGHNEEYVTKPVTDPRNALLTTVSEIYGDYNNAILHNSPIAYDLRRVPEQCRVVEKEEETIKSEDDSNWESAGIPSIYKNGGCEEQADGCCHGDGHHDHHHHHQHHEGEEHSHHQHHHEQHGNKVAPSGCDNENCCEDKKKCESSNSSSTSASTSASAVPKNKLSSLVPDTSAAVVGKTSPAREANALPLPPSAPVVASVSLNLLEDEEVDNIENSFANTVTESAPPPSSSQPAVVMASLPPPPAVANHIVSQQKQTSLLENDDDFENFLMGDAEEDKQAPLTKNAVVDVNDLLSL
eukprot:GDKJ01004953.1.p1 GENE.GDKJ01004953.1~~GDKJ01004953.1.p1  ORF type:complete len:1056 (+),score=286.85 GDKJ01004953.1:36-3203(+)